MQNPTPADFKSSDATNTTSGGPSSSLAAVSGAEGIETKQQVKHVLSKELQLYFERIANALTNEETDSVRETAIASLRSDPGLHQLVPYLVAFIAEKVCRAGVFADLDYAQSQAYSNFECHAPDDMGITRQPQRQYRTLCIFPHALIYLP